MPEWPTPTPLPGWAWYVPMKIDGAVAGLSGAVDDPIAIPGVPAALKAVCQPFGQDFRASMADGTILPHAHESWSAVEPVAHIRLPSQPAGEQWVYLWGGNPLAADAQNRAAVAAGYAGYWPLGDAGPTTAEDWTANANHGTQSGGVSFGAAGKAGPACSFDGANDVVATQKWHHPDSKTIGLFVRPGVAWNNATAVSFVGIAGAQDVSTNREQIYYNSNGGSHALEWSGPEPWPLYATYTHDFDQGTWIHVCCTVTGNDHRMYVDGALVSARSVAHVPISNHATLLGSDGQGGMLTGVLDNVSIYPAALPASRIALDALAYPGSALYQFGDLEAAPAGGGGSWWWNRFVRDRRLR